MDAPNSHSSKYSYILKFYTRILSGNDVVYYRFQLQCTLVLCVLMYLLMFKISIQNFLRIFSHASINLSPLSFITSSPNRPTTWLLIFSPVLLLKSPAIKISLEFPISAITSFNFPKNLLLLKHFHHHLLHKFLKYITSSQINSYVTLSYFRLLPLYMSLISLFN